MAITLSINTKNNIYNYEQQINTMISQGIWAYSIDFTRSDNTNWTSSKLIFFR